MQPRTALIVGVGVLVLLLLVGGAVAAILAAGGGGKAGSPTPRKRSPRPGPGPNAPRPEMPSPPIEPGADNGGPPDPGAFNAGPSDPGAFNAGEDLMLGGGPGLSQTMGGAGPPAAVDCAMGPWQSAGACVDGRRREMRAIITQPLNGGAPCGDEARDVECDGPSVGRFVFLTGACLNIAGLRVFSQGADVARGKAVEMSSMYVHPDWRFDPHLAVDGDDRTFAHTACVAGKNDYLMVDLGQEYSIDTIQIVNRQDCCQERLVGIRIDIGDANKAIVWSHTIAGPPLPVHTFKVNPRSDDPAHNVKPANAAPTDCVLGKVAWGERDTQDGQWVYQGVRQVLVPARDGGRCDNPMQTARVKKGSPPPDV